jgi:hypothetical protein
LIYYVLPFLVWLGFCAWKTLYTTTRLRLPHYVFAVPLILLATLRGEVGTDTAGYVQNTQNVIWWGGQASSGFEDGYVLLVRLFALVTSDPRVVVALISLLGAVLFFVMLHMWEQGGCILSLVFIPLSYFDFTMNALRMGIAFPLAAISIQQLGKRRLVLFYVLAIAAISIQMTAAVLLLMLFLARWGARLSWKGVACAILIGATVLYPAYYFFGDKIVFKMLSYSVISSPSSMSGSGPLLLSFCAALVAAWISKKGHRYLGFAFLLIQLACFRISSFSYAGLRFQEMALFAQMLALAYWIEWPTKKRYLAALLLLGCLTWGWTARNFIVTSGEASAFTPYHFIWEGQ